MSLPPNIKHSPLEPITAILSKFVYILMGLNGTFKIVGDERFSEYCSKGFCFCSVHPKKYKF